MINKAAKLLDELDKIVNGARSVDRQQIIAMVYGWAIKKGTEANNGYSGGGTDWVSGQQQNER